MRQATSRHMAKPIGRYKENQFVGMLTHQCWQVLSQRDCMAME